MSDGVVTELELIILGDRKKLRIERAVSNRVDREMRNERSLHIVINV